MVRVDWDLLVKSCRHVLGVLAWTWAIFLFLLAFLGGELEDEMEQPPILRQLIIPILKVLVIAPSLVVAQSPGSAGHHGNTQAGAAPGALTRFALDGVEVDSSSSANNGGFNLRDPPTSQHMDINDDGQYSFSYSAPHTARQERRNPDGSVVGKYSYVNPDGKLVEIEYTADATSGFNAYGENVPAKQVVDAPYPVQDTPEVQLARARFLDYYQREWNARKAQEAKENATATPPTSTIDNSDNKEPEVTVVLESSSQSPVNDDDEGDEDSEVINRDDPPKLYTANNNNNNNVDNSAGQTNQGNVPVAPQSLYTLQFDVGNNAPAQHHGLFQPLQVQSQSSIQQQQQQLPATKSTVSQAPGYFYYVGVGGLPYYVTSLPSRTNLAVSVRAHSLGAIPVAAIHDQQSHNFGQGVQRSKPHPAVYVEVGQDYTDLGQTPANTITAQHFRTANNNNNNQQGHGQQQGFNNNKQIYPVNFPFFGYPVFSY